MYVNTSKIQALTQQQRNNRRKRANPRQLAFLRRKFQEDPRPDQRAREIIGREIDMTPRSVQIWFQNNRAKARQQERRLASLYNVPIVTSNCGDNISRVYMDVNSSYTQSPRAIQRHTGGFNFRVPFRPRTSFESNTHIDSWKSEDDSMSISRSFQDLLAVHGPTGSSESLTSLFSNGTMTINSPYETTDIGDLYGTASACSDLNGSQSLESLLGGEETRLYEYLDSPDFITFELWNLQIRNWCASSDNYAIKMCLKYSNLFQMARIVMEMPRTGYVESEEDIKVMVLEFEVRNAVKLGEFSFIFEVRDAPTLYSVRTTDLALIPSSTDFTNGEVFSTNQYVLHGRLDDLVDGFIGISTSNACSTALVHSQHTIPRWDSEDERERVA